MTPIRRGTAKRLGLRRRIAYLASVCVLGFGISGSTTLALRWLFEGWAPIFPALLAVDLGALIVGTFLLVRLVLRDESRTAHEQSVSVGEALPTSTTPPPPPPAGRRCCHHTKEAT